MSSAERLANLLRAVALLALYVGAVVWLTWPFAEHPGETIFGEKIVFATDALYSLWAMDWSTLALSTAPTTLPDAPIYHPTPNAFFYGPSGFGGLPLFAPVFWASGNPVLATSVVFLGGVALTAWTMHLVVTRWTGSELAGVVAAATLLTNAWLVRGFVAATPHMAMLAYLPVLAWVTATPATSMRQALRIVPLVVLQGLTDLVYVAPAVFAVLGTVATLRLLRASTRPAGVRLLGALAISAVVLAPVYAGYAIVRSDNPDLAQQSAYHTAALFQRLPDQFVRPFAGPAVFLPATLVLVVLGAVAVAFRRPSATALAGWRQGAVWTALGTLISLAPLVLWNDVRVPVPQMLFPSVYTSVRAPARLGIVAMVGSAILAGLAFAALSRPTERAGRAGGVVLRSALAAAVVWGLYVGWGDPPGPFRTMMKLDPPAAPVLDVLRAEAGPVLEMPVQFECQQALAMFHATFHRRPLVNGYSSYFPATFPERMETTRKLPDPTALARLRDETGVTTIWVHLDRLLPRGRDPWLGRGMSARRDLQRVLLHGNDLIMRVVPSPGVESSPDRSSPG